MRTFLIFFWINILTVASYGWKMEANKITVDRTNGDVITHITFRQPFDLVPLVFTLTDDRGSHPASLRVNNVTTTGFDIYTVEPQGEDGPHLAMYSIPYIAIEPGDHTLPDGTRILAGTVSTKKYQSRLLPGSSWEHVDLSGFSTTPVVLGEIQTRTNERTDDPVPDAVSKPWITTAISNVDSGGFDIALERSETTEGSLTQDETIAYLVMESNLNGGDHYFGSNDGSKIEYETIRTDDAILGWDDGDYRVDFSKTYDDPIVVATKNTRNEADGGWLRRGKIKDNYLTLQVDEDRALDSERSHTGERAGLVLFSEPFDAEFLPTSQARMVINEVMYNETVTGTDNDEFVELYVTEGGDIRGYILSDQDGHFYRFPSCDVQKGEYVIFHTGGDPADNSCNGTVKHFYQGVREYWNNGDGDDVLLLRSAEDDVTIDGYGNTFNTSVEDYISYSESGVSAHDPPPTSMKGTSASWDNSYAGELKSAGDGVSIALTPNGRDSDTSACWEFSTSGNAADNGCSDYLPTRDTDPSSTYTYSIGANNNYLPEIHVLKSSIVLDDPVNGTTNPKRIPGATIRYCFTVDNNGSGVAEDVVLHERLSGEGRENLTYEEAAGQVQAATEVCDCTGSMSGATVTRSGEDLNISLGTIAPDQRGCAYIEMSID